MEEDIIKKMRKGKEEKLIVLKKKEEGVGIKVEMKGFGEGLEEIK